MFRSLKMRFMCGITAAAVSLNIAYPYKRRKGESGDGSVALLPIRQKRRGGE